MAISIVRESGRQLSANRSDVVKKALTRFVHQNATTPPEEGWDNLVRTPQAGVIVSSWRRLVKNSGGSLREMSRELFTDDELETLDAVESAIAERKGEGLPSDGGERGTRLVFRELSNAAFSKRTNDPLFGGEFGSSRFQDSLVYGIPKLRGTKNQGTKRANDWLNELFG